MPPFVIDPLARIDRSIAGTKKRPLRHTPIQTHHWPIGLYPGSSRSASGIRDGILPETRYAPLLVFIGTQPIGVYVSFAYF